MNQRVLEGDLNFDFFFKAASGQKTGYNPYPFQRRFVTSEKPHELIDIPTGLEKTDAIILDWVWRRRFDAREEIREETPRRLVYCLPMRVLVEQTKAKAKMWVKNLGIFSERLAEGDGIAVTVLMGGADKEDWDLYPEINAILIGTQDMLLSRSLNRRYGMSWYRWPMHFRIFNLDFCRRYLCAA